MSQAAMPLFPLTTVLFPQGVLNLQIFEVRYLDLMKKCLRDNTPFGVVSLLDGNEAVEYTIPKGRRAYLHVTRGRVTVNGHVLEAGDALKAGGELNPRYPGGLDGLRERLEAEGHSVVRKRKRYFVADYEKSLVTR